jgi:membrane protein required for beta-lactamase induction
MVGISIKVFIQSRLSFFVSIALSFITWGIITACSVWPEPRLRPRAEALRRLLMLLCFRFIGLAFLVPGVVSPGLPAALALSAAYGDIIAATLAVLAVLSLASAAESDIRDVEQSVEQK